MPKAMTSKERVLITLANQEADRVPIDYSANAGINRRLMEHYGVKDDWNAFLNLLGVDFREVNVPYTGARLHADIPGRGVKVDDWGIHTQWVEHGSGGYWDYCDFPLRDADEETVANWPMPSADDYDYSRIAADCQARREYAVYLGDPGLACIINTAGFFRGMEQTFVDLITDDPAGLLLIDRFMDIQFERTRRCLEAARGGYDFMWIGEDLGTQKTPLISMDLFRKHIQPRHQRFIDLAKAYKLPVMLHTCGSSSWAYEEYIKMGVNAVDTLQPEAANMSPEYLKKTFGGRLAFHGCISTGGPVAFGTVAETIADCRRTLEIMMPGGGYCFAPTHCLQDNSPTANVVAMYETARASGRYR
ncbi:MAG: uroporphyrinogen decarboxylase family protein [Lentisphaeria bacterium]|jgi:uroporphyrinogen-III decarboxylase